jgi:ribosomal protein L32
MNQKKCPHCGEYIRSNDLTCPKCFKAVPREPPAEVPQRKKEDPHKGRFGKASSTAVLLSILPPFIGLLGLGFIYLHPKERKGYYFLGSGLILFLPMVALFFLIVGSGFWSAMLLFIAFIVILLIYLLVAIGALIETIFGPILRMLRT